MRAGLPLSWRKAGLMLFSSTLPPGSRLNSAQGTQRYFVQSRFEKLKKKERSASLENGNVTGCPYLRIICDQRKV